MSRYFALKDRYLESDPEVKGGETVIRGTRLTARAVFARLEGGDTLEDLASDYPYIEPEAFAVAAEWVRRSEASERLAAFSRELDDMGAPPE